MSQFKKIYIDKEGERGIDLLENDLIICQKTNARGCEQLRGVVCQVNDDNIGASLPRLAMASAWHETQYTRLFRS